MRLSISNIAWEVEEDDNVASILQKEGIHWIDLAPGKYFADFKSATISECKAVKDWWWQRGINILGMQSLLYGTRGLNVFGSAESQESLLDHLGAICRIGDALDARRLVFGSPKNRDRSGLSDQVAFDKGCEFFLQLAKIAEADNVKICLEPNPKHYGCNFMTTTKETAAIVAAVNHPCIRMQLDTGSLTMNQEDPNEICDSFHHLIGHIHASEPELKPVGEGTCRHGSCAKAIRHYFPDALVCIEMLTAAKAEPLATIEASVRFAKQAYLSIL